jgi:Ca-activated chloride channel family protein
MMKVEIDEQLMKNIARKTDGKYFRATSNSNWPRFMLRSIN